MCIYIYIYIYTYIRVRLVAEEVAAPPVPQPTGELEAVEPGCYHY